MSIVKVQSALETALNGMTPALSTQWENTPFAPATGTAYQQAFLIPSEPNNPEISDGYQEIGIFQISLRYPLQTGRKAAQDRAELIRTTFKRGNSFTSGGVTVTVAKTPHIGTGAAVDDRWFLPVKIQYYANINL